jgi:ABC-2 type transport system permease protein
MFLPLRRKFSIYGAIAAIIPKVYLAYSLWVWVSLILNTIALTILVFFWRAVYSNTSSIGGLDLQTTLNYILLAQVFLPLSQMNMIFEMGYNLREGGIAHVLLRPLDFQFSYYVQSLATLGTDLILQIPLALVATFLFHLDWPTDIRVWIVFIITAFLGKTVLFLFDFMLGCLTFYTTEVWGLGVLVFGMGLFFSGSLIPLAMLPEGLSRLVYSLPFAQALYVPLSLLSGIQPLSAAPSLWLVQIAWLIGLLVISRLVFKITIRKITVQGG